MLYYVDYSVFVTHRRSISNGFPVILNNARRTTTPLYKLSVCTSEGLLRNRGFLYSFCDIQTRRKERTAVNGESHESFIREIFHALPHRESHSRASSPAKPIEKEKWLENKMKGKLEGKE